MPILGIIASSITGGLSTNSYESISTVTVGSGGSASIEFTSIPATYTHLQIRVFTQTNRATYNVDSIKLQVGNSTIDTGNNYSFHTLYSQQSSPGTSVGSAAITSASSITAGVVASNIAANTFGVSIIDILDYANTNKYKTVRCLSGADTNGAAAGFAGFLEIESGLWQSTSAINRILISPVNSSLLSEYSSFALYGIKGA
jgi:hypothetical protein